MYRQKIQIRIKEEYIGSVTWEDNKLSDEDIAIQQQITNEGLVVSSDVIDINPYTKEYTFIYRDKSAFDRVCSLSKYQLPIEFEYFNDRVEEI